MTTAQVLFLSHGGGPMPLLGDPAHQQMVDNLTQLATQLRRPKQLIVVSAHWETSPIAISHDLSPSLYYDYNGFPPESYDIPYPVSGHPQLAEAIQQTLQQKGITSQLATGRGLDHGVFVPLKILYPEADIPCLQVSLHQSLDPERHIQLGEALAKVADADTLIIGSGFTFHNMRAFMTSSSPEDQAKNQAFEDWLIDTCTANLPEAERRQRLQQWALAPHARYCHPREEHLLPLHVCYGATQRACDQFDELTILNKQASVYLWR